jgi:hypothetical protein
MTWVIHSVVETNVSSLADSPRIRKNPFKSPPCASRKTVSKAWMAPFPCSPPRYVTNSPKCPALTFSLPGIDRFHPNKITLELIVTSQSKAGTTNQVLPALSPGVDDPAVPLDVTLTDGKSATVLYRPRSSFPSATDPSSPRCAGGVRRGASAHQSGRARASRAGSGPSPLESSGT